MKLSAINPIYFGDGRTDLYDDAFLRQYLRVMNGDGWEDVFRQNDIRLAVLESDAPLVGTLEKAGWTKMSSDKTISIFTQ